MADKKISDFASINFTSLADTDVLVLQTNVGATNAYKSLTKAQLVAGIDARITNAFSGTPDFPDGVRLGDGSGGTINLPATAGDGAWVGSSSGGVETVSHVARQAKMQSIIKLRV
jgi:hypothetical protein